ncbi:MAG: bifunctional 5,10-methylenetetrahydrofolate dehydrogenase/5,10-methenyltetrahydrofolate cyclohydrolase [Candidatus Shapirobacteria bacterium]|nr:bifunctional 5,10-methylenetetrahydrofolate dehydrogenase/5,10-methenyltetrahydrofolate cyclohydrolase [Candidatus Shapirobacteria bacterium]MDD4410795.1 bifunctional 5,10-methylenetetrahydrofolate dehydrogenase/5,10-methenyltetrahydrofolate cyclohydrolase [Candidatus Shapirobacteria bacterium]
MIILDGKTLSQKILDDLKLKISNFKLKPTLDIIIVGTDSASQKYVALKQQKAQSIGISGNVHQLSESSTTADLLSLVNKLNKDDSITAFMVQLPLPSQIDTEKVLANIDHKKDADGLNPFNLGLLFQKGSTGIASATACGIIKLLEEYKIDISGKNAVIIGRSSEVSIPLFALLLGKNSTVTICHSHTQNLKEICQKADILISAVGKPKFLTKDFIREGAVVIDVGFGTDSNGQVSGDFDFDQVSKIASFITPVPGGVGPMTIASLLFNTVQIAKN